MRQQLHQVHNFSLQQLVKYPALPHFKQRRRELNLLVQQKQDPQKPQQ